MRQVPATSVGSAFVIAGVLVGLRDILSPRLLSWLMPWRAQPATVGSAVSAGIVAGLIQAALAAATTIILLWAGYWLWRLARGRSGAGALFLAFAVHLAAAATTLVLTAALVAVARWTPSPQALRYSLAAQAYAPGVVGLLGMLLLVYGLFTTRLVPAWIAGFGAVDVVLSLVSAVLTAPTNWSIYSGAADSRALSVLTLKFGVVTNLSLVVSALFWVVLGVALLVSYEPEVVTLPAAVANKRIERTP